jgi:hypothetical protein
MKVLLSVLPEHVVIGYLAPDGFDVCNWDIVRPGERAFELPYEELRALGSGPFEIGDTPEERRMTPTRRITISEFSRAETHTP